jgi:ABC-type uncharacterized transport system fused permease/ATPase subunit
MSNTKFITQIAFANGPNRPRRKIKKLFPQNMENNIKKLPRQNIKKDIVSKNIKHIVPPKI